MSSLLFFNFHEILRLWRVQIKYQVKVELVVIVVRTSYVAEFIPIFQINIITDSGLHVVIDEFYKNIYTITRAFVCVCVQIQESSSLVD